ncbi:hypothetical protein L3Q82_004394 [Scortum barcoo]|uniref:Uncharacterized protein n=1 Tax=Scortum barcoo TaxID=214431 RepID=A0ACB8VJZ1_9TELE|nr:hypothetical protein L3Q82_004394 [Scortum barcoo]
MEKEAEEKQEVEEESEVKVEQEAEKEPEVEQEAEEKPKVEQEAEEESEVEQEAEEKPEVEQEAEEESEVKVEQEAEEESEVKMEKDAEEKQEVKAQLELKVDLEDNVKPEFEMEPELQEIPDFKVESEVQVEPELEPMFKEEQEAQQEFHVQMNLEEETEAGGESEERHIDMENKYHMVGETLMELEPLDDDNMFEEGKEEPIRELEPVTEEESFEQQRVLPDAAFMDEGPALDIMGQPIAPMEEYFPNVEARMVMEPEKHSHPGENLMMEEPVNEYVNEEESYAVMGDSPGGVEGRSLGQNKQGWGCSSGMALEGKCYQFFKELKVAADAELFCQEQFTGGHLASITSQYIHKELVNMIHQQNGPYRAWVGGLRYKTGRLIWLDGSHWGYADWLSGEPSNVEDVECVEVLANN